jgi:hypothetical protein
MDATAILLIVALVLFVLAAFGVGGRVAWGWLGLAAVTLALLLNSGRLLL